MEEKMYYGAAVPVSDDEIARRLSEFGLEYLGGYLGSEYPVTVKCMRCNEVSTISMRTVRHRTAKYCRNCILEIKRDNLAIEKEKQKQRQAKQRELKRIEKQRQRVEEKEQEKITRLNEIHICKCCEKKYRIADTGYNSKSYCSKRCQERLYERRHNQKRDHRKRWRKHDSDITLEKLFKKDDGICWLCGLRCNWDDFKIKSNGVHVAGNYYPSVDHVIPLAKGGTDTWDNVRLAHRRCNSIKKDKVI